MNSQKQFRHLFENKKTPSTSEFESYFCLEQPETCNLLKFLTFSPNQNHIIPEHTKKQTPNKALQSYLSNRGHNILFNSEIAEEVDRSNLKKEKNFYFDGIFQYEQKNKHYFQQQIKEICEMALIGYSQNVFVYGTEEQPKDRLLIGQSQNPGLFLSVLSYLFEYCHEKGLEDYVTVKLSAPVHKNGKFLDIFSNNQPVSLRQDKIQGLILQTCPQIIIRNVKTGLKLLNLILKSVKQLRQNDLTQNLILSLKIEIDWESRKQDSGQETSIYCLSKINFIKLANPSINSSLKGINKNNVWFVNLFNLLRNFNNQVTRAQDKKNAEKQEELDDFTKFIKETIIEKSQKIYCLTSATNRMSSNECLTALLFSNYLKSAKTTKITRNFINLPQYESFIHNLIPNIDNSFKKISNNISDTVHKFLSKLNDFQQIKNYLEYEYSLVIGEACQKLNKYIFTEELEDFYYAKKIPLESSTDLQETYKDLKRCSSELIYLRKFLEKKLRMLIDEKTSEELIRKFSEFLELLMTMGQHFLIEQDHFKNIGKQMDIQLEFIGTEIHKKQPIDDENEELQRQKTKSNITTNQANTNPFEQYKEDNKQTKISDFQIQISNELRNPKQKKTQIIDSLKPISERDESLSVVRHKQQVNELNSPGLQKEKNIQNPKQNIQLNNQTDKIDNKNHQKKSPLHTKNRNSQHDNLTLMFTNKNIGYKSKANRY